MRLNDDVLKVVGHVQLHYAIVAQLMGQKARVSDLERDKYIRIRSILLLLSKCARKRSRQNANPHGGTRMDHPKDTHGKHGDESELFGQAIV